MTAKWTPDQAALWASENHGREVDAECRDDEARVKGSIAGSDKAGTWLYFRGIEIAIKPESARFTDGLPERAPYCKDDGKHCNDIAGYGWVCTRSKGHAGQHVAHTSDGAEVSRESRWDSAPAAAPETVTIGGVKCDAKKIADVIRRHKESPMVINVHAAPDYRTALELALRFINVSDPRESVSRARERREAVDAIVRALRGDAK